MANPYAAQDIQTIDSEHQVQIYLLNALRHGVEKGRDVTEIRQQLTDYCKTHFLSEELLMRLHGYPAFDEHVIDHEQLLDALDGLVGIAEVEALSSFLLRHIKQQDAKFHAYLRAL